MSLAYVSPDHTVYSAMFNPVTELFTSLQVNENNKGSYQVKYDWNDGQSWTLDAIFYQAANDQGVETQIVYNWEVGGSQVQTFNNLPKGYTKRLSNYSGLNGTGNLISTTYA